MLATVGMQKSKLLLDGLSVLDVLTGQHMILNIIQTDQDINWLPHENSKKQLLFSKQPLTLTNKLSENNLRKIRNKSTIIYKNFQKKTKRNSKQNLMKKEKYQ